MIGNYYTVPSTDVTDIEVTLDSMDAELANERIAQQTAEYIRCCLRAEARTDRALPVYQPSLTEYGTIRGRWHSISCACEPCLNTDYHVIDPAELGHVNVIPTFMPSCWPGYDSYRCSDKPDERLSRYE